MIPAPNACATASDTFFLCILFIMDPHGVGSYNKVVIASELVLNRSRAQRRASPAQISYFEHPEESEPARE
jgi:hypothetical protein